MNKPLERRIETPHLQLAALHWNNPGAPKVLALHGWLDNAASFIPMGPYLDQLDLVALDLPGHGRSQWYPPGKRYHFIDYLTPVISAADALGWDSFHLLGHSLGGAAATLLAAGIPERIISLNVIEALGPLSEDEQGTAKRLQMALADKRINTRRNQKQYPDVATVARARAQHSGFSMDIAELLVARSLKALSDDPADGVQWTSDPRLTLTTLIRMTEAQVLDIIRHIQAPTLVIMADPPSPILNLQLRQSRMALLQHGRLELLPGHHHLHMEIPAEVAALVQSHISETESAMKD